MKCKYCDEEITEVEATIILITQGVFVVEDGSSQFYEDDEDVAIIKRCGNCGRELDGNIDELLGVKP